MAEVKRGFEQILSFYAHAIERLDKKRVGKVLLVGRSLQGPSSEAGDVGSSDFWYDVGSR